MTKPQHELMNWLYDQGYLDIGLLSKAIHEFSGMASVIDHMEKYHPEVDWGRCDTCDNNDVPLTNYDWSEIMICLVCGSPEVSVNCQLALF